jgi:hypothetical protein
MQETMESKRRITEKDLMKADKQRIIDKETVDKDI